VPDENPEHLQDRYCSARPIGKRLEDPSYDPLTRETRDSAMTMVFQ